MKIIGLIFVSTLAWGSPLGILEVHENRGARDIESAGVMYLIPRGAGFDVSYAVCSDPTKVFSKACAESGLVATMPYKTFDDDTLAFLNLHRFRVLRDLVNDGNDNVQAYTDALRSVADKLTPEQARVVEGDLEKGVSAIETARAEMKKIQAESKDYLTYKAVFDPLQSEELEGAVREPLYSTVHVASVRAALAPFRKWRFENVCSCREYRDGKGRTYCVLRRGKQEFGFKTANAGECQSRKSCAEGKWFWGSPQLVEGKPTAAELPELLEGRCKGYYEARAIDPAADSPRAQLSRVKLLDGRWRIKAARSRVSSIVSFSNLAQGRPGQLTLDYSINSLSRTEGVDSAAFTSGTAVCTPGDAMLAPEEDRKLDQYTAILSCLGGGFSFVVKIYTPALIYLRVDKIEAAESGTTPFAADTAWDLEKI